MTPSESQHLKSAIADLVGVLKLYEKNAAICRLIHKEGDSGRHWLSADGGKLARIVIEKYGEIK